MTSPASLPAGAELDRLIAEKVMGYVVVDVPFVPRDVPPNALLTKEALSCYRSTYPHGDGGRPIPPFSTNIAHAFEVVEKMDGSHWQIEQVPEIGWRVAAWLDADRVPVFTWAGTAPWAICNTALALLAAGGGQ